MRPTFSPSAWEVVLGAPAGISPARPPTVSSGLPCRRPTQNRLPPDSPSRRASLAGWLVFPGSIFLVNHLLVSPHTAVRFWQTQPGTTVSDKTDRHMHDDTESDVGLRRGVPSGHDTRSGRKGPRGGRETEGAAEPGGSGEGAAQGLPP